MNALAAVAFFSTLLGAAALAFSIILEITRIL